MWNPWVLLIAFSVMMVFGVGFLAIWTEHLQKIAQIRSKGGSKESAELGRQIADLREEVAKLRETATQYDLSFDQALQRLEQRVSAVERRQDASATREAERLEMRQGGGG